MTIQVEVWLRGTDVATTGALENIATPPAAWRDADVKQVLEGMLRTMHQLKHGSEADVVSLRGLSWIVNPFEGGMLIAIEIGLGAAVAGPFDIEKSVLEDMIARVLEQTPSPPVVTH